MFYILLKDEKTRDALMNDLRSKGIFSVFHYLPLHLSRIGRSMGYQEGDLPVTESTSAQLLRLPFYYELKREEQGEIVAWIKKFFGRDESS
jgi:dTDP-4-amino-4,6-dideoxygalactose transaminase